MFVLTVDQVDSRNGEDRVAGILADRDGWRARGAVRGPDRTAGDEFQLLVPQPAAALDAVLRLTRDGRWSVGLGIGEVETPLPPTTGEARGTALIAARDAVEAAKRDPRRFAVAAAGASDASGVSALVGLLLEIRARRTPEGWQVADLAAEGLTQARIAARLGVTPQAISLRARAAAVRLEQESVPALAAALGALDVGPPA
ncbi:DNA-binding protein [uncultured Amnibacterium sp.]|uniref:DNA-binding protein n=1 Tax=uncultured Amnibacterium sp. TaxID=1631851 RepID=UPI0035CAE0C2